MMSNAMMITLWQSVTKFLWPLTIPTSHAQPLVPNRIPPERVTIRTSTITMQNQN
ncbi:hypothetical protein BDV41DRAFT_551903 [Aspergillus transmontanensis]|uniref:Uncharacterized protein n=1 Tax=Aspergillus transmontanensis TaxID=1034304 RepID=A0A5N6VIJ8_9EURO|nr:hypothetical protein BDV41DRAFT_551903 [Aspergillus transmontanensis]